MTGDSSGQYFVDVKPNRLSPDALTIFCLALMAIFGGGEGFLSEMLDVVGVRMFWDGGPAAGRVDSVALHSKKRYSIERDLYRKSMGWHGTGKVFSNQLSYPDVFL